MFHVISKFDSSPSEQNGRYYPDDIFKCIFLNERHFLLIRISQTFVSKDPINNNTALVQLMARRQAVTWTNADSVQQRIYMRR